MSHLGPHLNVVNLLGACTKGGTTPSQRTLKSAMAKALALPAPSSVQGQQDTHWRAQVCPVQCPHFTEPDVCVGLGKSQNHITSKTKALPRSPFPLQFPNQGFPLTFEACRSRF